MKDNKEVISEFNEYVNMTASELEKWLQSDDSNSAGWTKDGGDGESVGHDSGRKIVEILKSNPNKDPEKYTDDQLAHMRKVASYCKRHLAQESSGNSNKDEEELTQTKSYISLKNWGHDFLKAQGKGSSNGSKSGSKQKAKKDDVREEEADEDGEDEPADDHGEPEEDEAKEKKTGDKRKKSGQQKGSNKKQETGTRKTRSSSKKDAKADDDAEEQEAEEEDDDTGKEEGKESKGKKAKSGKKGPKKGDTVSWSWGSGNPKGKVLDVKEDKYVSHRVLFALVS